MKAKKSGKPFLAKPKTITLEHDVDVTAQLEVAREIIDFIYQANYCHKHPNKLPEKFHDLPALVETSQAVITWLLGKRNRWTVKPAPFFGVYGQDIIHNAERKTIRLMYQNGLVFSAPELEEGDVLKWVRVMEHTIEFHIKQPFVLPGIHMPEPEEPPFNIRDIPNVIICEPVENDK